MVLFPGDRTFGLLGLARRYFGAYSSGQFSFGREIGETETYIEPDIVSFFRRRRDFHLPLGRRDNNTVLIETRRHGIRVKHRAYTFNVS
jgi:hypothetical protein